MTLDRVPAVLTVPEVAAVLRVGRNQAYQLINSGQLYGVRCGRSIRIPRQSVELFLGLKQNGDQAAIPVAEEFLASGQITGLPRAL